MIVQTVAGGNQSSPSHSHSHFC